MSLYVYIVELRTPAMPVGVGGGKERGDFIWTCGHDVLRAASCCRAGIVAGQRRALGSPKAAKGAGKGAGKHLKPGWCLTLLSEATRKPLVLRSADGHDTLAGHIRNSETPWPAGPNRLSQGVPPVAVWSPWKISSEASVNVAFWSHFFSGALPLQMSGVGGLASLAISRYI